MKNLNNLPWIGAGLIVISFVYWFAFGGLTKADVPETDMYDLNVTIAGLLMGLGTTLLAVGVAIKLMRK